MAFQIKDFASIVAGQIVHARAVTDRISDFQPGSVVRTIMEAPATEIEELYLQFFLGLRDAIPVATFLSFGFDLLPPAVARGFVSISRGAPAGTDLVIPAGTVFETADGRAYASSESVTWPAADTIVRVLVHASAVGSGGNVAADAIVTSPSFGDGFTIGNEPIATGRDTETTEEREARFGEFVRALSRGTLVACEYAARQASVLDENGNMLEYVARIGVIENPGYVRIYVYSSAGVSSADLIEDGQRRIDGWRDEASGDATPGFRPAGVRVDVLPMVERIIPMTISVGMMPGQSLTEATRQRLGDVFAASVRSIQPGETLYIGTLVEMLLGVQGVRSVVPAANENIVCGLNEALIPGALTVLPL